MIVHSGFEDWTPGQNTIASLGNFDGVHLGHQAILQEVVSRAKVLFVPSVAVTFDPVPKKILYPETAPPLIQTLDQRLQKMESLKLDHAVVIHFNHEFARKSPEDFVVQYLVRVLKIKGFIVGENFSFGHQKKGNILLLREMGGQYSFFVESIPEIRIDGLRVSSTLIRQRITQGKIEDANRYLGDPFRLAGNVVEGEKLGRKLGIPTANLRVENEILPARGVYIGRALLENGRFPAVTNVGIRPTLGGQKLTVETHILNYSANLYGRHMELEFLTRMREEIRFANIEELKSQIHSDIQQAHQYFLKPGA